MRDRYCNGAMWTLAPCTCRQIRKALGEVVDEYLFGSREHFAYRPWLADAGLNDRRSGRICRIDSRLRDEVRPRPVRIDEVDQAERKIVEVSADAAANRGEQLIQLTRVGDLRGSLTQYGQPAFGDISIGIFDDDAEQAADVAVVVRQRAVGEGMIGLFGEAGALQQQEEILIVSRLAMFDDFFDPWS